MSDDLVPPIPPLPVSGDQIDHARQREFLAAATADNTRRTYRSAIRHFLAWGGSLPADEALLLRYLLAYAPSLNPRTLSLRLTAISVWHQQQNFPDPTVGATVRKTLLGISRIHGTPKQKARALAVADLAQIAAHLASLATLAALRDNALLQLAYFGAFRRSEVVRLAVDAVRWAPEGIVVTLPRSKTDQSGQGIVKAIPFGGAPCCPATALRRWLDASGIVAGPMFRSLSQWGELGDAALHEGGVNTILRQAALGAGIPYAQQLSSHSLRRGMATSAYRAGAALRDIKRQGGWRHDATVQGYIDDAGQFEENAALILLKPRR